jgi:hypothetical protein
MASRRARVERPSTVKSEAVTSVRDKHKARATQAIFIGAIPLIASGLFIPAFSG